MSTKDRYDASILKIEEEVGNNISASDIAFKVAQSTGLSVRDMSTIINYMTDMPALSYIRRRKLMAAYSFLVSVEDLDIDSAVLISGYDNQSSFSKAFRGVFNMTPKEAYINQNTALYEEPMTWDMVSCRKTKNTEYDQESDSVEETTIFGITKEQYARVMEAAELQALYGFDQNYSQAAYEVAKTKDLPLKDAFEFLDSVRSFFQEMEEIDAMAREEMEELNLYKEDEPESKESLDPEFEKSQIRDCAFDPDLQYLFFTCHLSVGLALRTLDRLPEHFYDPEKAEEEKNEFLKMKPHYIFTYAHTVDFSYPYYKKACDYFDAHANGIYRDENFEKYIDYISAGMPIETAFSTLIPEGIFDDIGRDADIDDEDYSLPPTIYDRMEEEEQKWYERNADNYYDYDDGRDEW